MFVEAMCGVVRPEWFISGSIVDLSSPVHVLPGTSSWLLERPGHCVRTTQNVSVPHNFKRAMNSG